MSDSIFGPFYAGLYRAPDAAINKVGPLPLNIPAMPPFNSADGQFNQHSFALPGLSPYAYGTSARISTQTQMAHPNRVQLIIPKLYLPAPQADAATLGDPVLEHTISDGDLVFTFRMSPDMTAYGSNYFEAPYGYYAKAVPLINLATVNYILWGLQVGMRLPRHSHWSNFFKKLLRTHRLLTSQESWTETQVWNFLKTYIRPFGIQHGGDMQGGRHEGDSDPIVTHGAVDYVTSFAIEGKLLHVNNLWRDFDVHEGDDLGLTLTRMNTPHADISFDLSSSVRSQRTERVPVTSSWYYLRPTVMPFKSFSDEPFIHIGRSQKYCSLFSRGADVCCWNARMAVVPGAPLQLTFEPDFIPSDDMFYAQIAADDESSNRHISAIHHDDRDDELLASSTVPFPVPTFHFPATSDGPGKKRHVLATALGVDLDNHALSAASDATKSKRSKTTTTHSSNAKSITTKVVTSDGT